MENFPFSKKIAIIKPSTSIWNLELLFQHQEKTPKNHHATIGKQKTSLLPKNRYY